MEGFQSVSCAAIAAIATFCCISSPARADATARMLKETCQAYPAFNTDTAFCIGYVAGTLDQYHFYAKTLGIRPFCQPDELTGEKLIPILKQYLGELRSEELADQAASAIFHTMLKRYPCPN